MMKDNMIVIGKVKASTPSVIEFNGNTIRMVIGDDGDPRFVAKDLARAISVEPVGHYIDHIPGKYKGMHSVHTPGGAQEIMCLTEAGMNQFLFRSNKPAAIPWQEHLAEVVLPSIRKTGSYSAKPLTNIQMLLAQAQAMADLEAAQLEQSTRLQATINRVERIEESQSKRAELESDTEIGLAKFPEPSVEVRTKSVRAILSEYVRTYAISHGGGELYQTAWRKVYNELKSRYSFDAKIRAKNSGLSKLDEVEKAHLMNELYAVACEVLV